jgi:hypothetical protein
MLDAYIIDRIRRERRQEQEKRDGAFVPLHIEVPRDDRPPEDPPDRDDPDRGTTTIDFRL